MNSNWSYSPETVKLGVDLCDLDLWPLTLTFCIDVTFVIDNNSWKFHDDTMLGTWLKRCDRRTDRRTNGRADRLNQSYSCLVAAKTFKDMWQCGSGPNLLPDTLPHIQALIAAIHMNPLKWQTTRIWHWLPTLCILILLRGPKFKQQVVCQFGKVEKDFCFIYHIYTYTHSLIRA